MGNEKQSAKNMSKIEPRSLCLGLLIGCSVFFFTYLTMSKPFVISFTSMGSVSSPSSAVPARTTVEDKGSSQQLENRGPDDATKEMKFKARSEREVSYKSQQPGTENKQQSLRKKIGNRSIQQNSPSDGDSSRKTDNRQPERENTIENHLQMDANDRTQKTSPINNLIQGADPQMSGTGIETKITCNLRDPRSDLCEMEGDVRIHGRSASVVVVNSQEKGSWRLKPYTRKGFDVVMSTIRDVNIRSSSDGRNEAACTVRSSVPAVVFATGGYTGNYFHTFSDIMVPLFTTVRQFDGEVQLLISHMDGWWMGKYAEIVGQLSRYKAIDLDNDDQVRCYRHVIVGLHSHNDLIMEPKRTPGEYSMVDFKKAMFRAYSLERETAGGGGGGKPPRLLIMSRGRNRRLVNAGEVAERARAVGFEVVVTDPRHEDRVADFARVVNSCDVMVGVHGAGLTNEVFLPLKGVLIQIVPWGRLDGMAKYCFGNPAVEMGMSYLQYSISEEESTLMEHYPRDHPVFKNPQSLHDKGWVAMADIFLSKQDVRIDLDRFNPVLLQALELLKQ